MEIRGLRSLAGASLLLFAFPVGAAEPAGQLERCLGGRDLPRVARVQLPDGRTVYARVTADSDGVPTAAVPIAGADLDLADTVIGAGMLAVLRRRLRGELPPAADAALALHALRLLGVPENEARAIASEKLPPLHAKEL